jgi:hypothetical protein
MWNILIYCLLSILPLPGNIYSSSINIPFIGVQKIKTYIKKGNSASIRLEGIINKNGVVKYYEKNNIPKIYISYNLRKIQNQYNIDYSLPYYDNILDEITFDINIKKFKLNKKIVMKKIN